MTPEKIDRRKWFQRVVRLGEAGLGAGLGYSFLETFWIETTRTQVAVPRLPSPFVGLTIAFLTDIHHGGFTGLNFVGKIVDATNELAPDLVLLGGDYVLGNCPGGYFAPCFAELARLSAPLGVWSVPGNHDHWQKIDRYYAALNSTSIGDLANRGIWLERGGARLRLAGVDDFWCGRQDLDAALGDCTAHDACLLLSHNPDYVETIKDPRVGLVLSGHTHGGQILLPLIPPQVPSAYGGKYLKGLIQGPVTQVFVSRGLGTVGLPLRFRARPEIAMLKLIAA